MEIRFTWNAEKARSNRRKHGVSFEEALTVFAHPLARIHDDPQHSEGERREIIVGHSSRGRLILYRAPRSGTTHQGSQGDTP
jgi:hypothetical protein